MSTVSPLPRFRLVVSDFHLGKGRYFPDGTPNILEDFVYDREFAEFLSYYRSGPFADAEVELVLNGDILNLLQIDTWGVYTHLITERSVIRGVERIVQGHPDFFQALRRFAATPGHTVSYVVGNHDVGMLWPGPRRVFTEAVGAAVTFYDVFYQVDGIYIEHGQQYERFARVDMQRPFITRKLPEPVLNLPWGSLFVAMMMPRIKQERPHVDKVRPFSAFIRWCLIHDFWWGMKTGARIVKFVFDTVLFRRRYQIRDGVGATLGLIKEITLYPNYDRIAFKILEDREDVHTVIFGHTHILRYRQWHGGKQYFNEGTWNETTNLALDDYGRHTRLTYAYIEYPQAPPPVEGSSAPSIRAPAASEDQAVARPVAAGGGRADLKRMWRNRNERQMMMRSAIVVLLVGVFFSFQASADVCARTSQVVTVLEAATQKPCASITPADLASVKRLELPAHTFSNPGVPLRSLKAGDFDGLSSLTSLSLVLDMDAVPEDSLKGMGSLEFLALGGRIGSLAEKLFEGLASLQGLSISSSELATLPDALLSGLSSLRRLNLSSSQLTALPERLLSGLLKLESVAFVGFAAKTLPEKLFSGLPSLEEIDAQQTRIASLPPGLFAGLSHLKRIALNQNQLSQLPSGIFSGLPALDTIQLISNQLASLPPGLFSGLASLELLSLRGNQLADLPDGIFSGLPALRMIDLNLNLQTRLRPGLFSGLPALSSIDLGRNRIVRLDPGAFSNCPSVSYLDLDENQLTTLPDRAFAGLPGLKTLSLSKNNLESLSEGAFAGLPSLTQINLHYNQLTALPEGLLQGIRRLDTFNIVSNRLTSVPEGLFASQQGSLTLLNLTGNPLPQATKDFLTMQLPKTHIGF